MKMFSTIISPDFTKALRKSISNKILKPLKICFKWLKDLLTYVFKNITIKLFEIFKYVLNVSITVFPYNILFIILITINIIIYNSYIKLPNFGFYKKYLSLRTEDEYVDIEINDSI